ncbi:MAG: hypothetical protein V4484_23655 [Pseudomonadota bacterium]
MFWKFIRWGGSAIVALLVLAATLLSGQPEQANTPATQAQPGKNFNL